MFGNITEFDFSVLYFIQEHFKNPVFDFLMPIISAIGEGGVIWFVICMPMLFFKKTRPAAAAGLTALVLTFITGELVIKNIVCRVRPCNIDFGINMLVERPTSYSFPSGHTGTSFACSAGIFSFNKRLGTPCLVFAAIMGFSRLYNFVHFPTDVIAGALLGAAFAVCVYFAFTSKRLNIAKKLGGR